MKILCVRVSSVSSQITVSLSIRLSLNSFPHKRNIFHGSFHPVTDAILAQDSGKVIQKNRICKVVWEYTFCYIIKGVKYHAEQIILFGSRAKGTALERSDIDIAVSGVDDFDSLLDAVDAIQTLYTIDLLNMDTCGNELILEDIKKYGRKI